VSFSSPVIPPQRKEGWLGNPPWLKNKEEKDKPKATDEKGQG
jgi:hypothetical protein